MILTIIQFIPSATSGNDPVYQVLTQQLDYRQKHILIIILICQNIHMEYFIKPRIFYLILYMDLNRSNGKMMKSLILPQGILKQN